LPQTRKNAAGAKQKLEKEKAFEKKQTPANQIGVRTENQIAGDGAAAWLVSGSATI